MTKSELLAALAVVDEDIPIRLNVAGYTGDLTRVLPGVDIRRESDGKITKVQFFSLECAMPSFSGDEE